MKNIPLTIGLVLAMVSVFLLASRLQAAQGPQQVDVFVSSRDGYHTYRIPAVIVTNKGTLLIFCEGRKTSRSDTGDIDMLLKRSMDGGKTFSDQQVIWDDGPNTCGNPCPVVDRDTGRIWLLMTHNLGVDNHGKISTRTGKGTRTVWITHSDDDGKIWAQPVEITKDVKPPEWTWYATGPGVGIQLKRGPHKGRLIVPCDYTGTLNKSFVAGSHIIYSDDHGTTWKLGGLVKDNTNECQIIERTDGSLMLNMRWWRKAQTQRRKIATSTDGGITWSKAACDQTLISPCCQASLIRYNPSDTKGRSMVLFSNPAHITKRLKMTVRLSYDEGVTWPASKLLWKGPTAYSCLTVLRDGRIGCLYERGNKHPYEKITFAKFDLAWLTQSAAKQTTTGPSTMVVQPLLRDPDSKRGFKVYDPKPGKHIARGVIQADPTLGDPTWGLAQWSSRYSLADATPQRLDNGAVRFADDAKAVTVGPAKGSERGLVFTLNAGREYGERFRRRGEPWPHLLAEQRFVIHPAIVKLAELRFYIEYRLKSSKSYTPPSDRKVAGQAAQFLAYLTIQNLNRKSSGFGDFFWFGIPMYDSRYRSPKHHAALDKGTGKFIYNPAGSVYTNQSAHDGDWITIDHDLLPLINTALKTAWQRGYMPQSRDLTDICLGGFNIGWELPGTLDVEMQFRDLRIEAVAK
ncbi:MAG: sialidase family protein [Planctomycetota bacterium]|jgi:sialidase-1